MRYWVEVEDSTSGVRLGPILAVMSWDSTALRNGAGSFSFALPATDPAAALLAVNRTVRCWVVDRAAPRIVAAGTIQVLTLTEDANGAPTLTVSGPSLLGELAWRSVDDLALREAVVEHPAHVYTSPMLNGATPNDDETYRQVYAYVVYDNQVGDVTTGAQFDGTFPDFGFLSATDANRVYVYVRCVRSFTGLQITVSSAPYAQPMGTTDITLAAQYYNAESEGWDALSIESDGTDLVSYSTYGNTYHHTLAQSGTVRWSLPSGWGVADGEATYKIRLSIAAGNCGTSVVLSDVAVLYNRPTADALDPIIALAPVGWSLDAAHGYTSIAAATETSGDLIVNGSFEAVTGTVDDTTTDMFASWTNDLAGAEKALAVSDALSDGTAVQLVYDAGTGNCGLIYQELACEPAADYILRFWAKSAAGTGHPVTWVQDRSGSEAPFLVAPYYTAYSGTEYQEFEQAFTTPAISTAIRVVLYGYGGDVLFDNVRLYRRLGGEVYLDFAGETVLEALGRVAETTGETFIQSPYGRREVLWLRADERRSGLLAVAPAAGDAAERNSNLCLITSLEEVESAYDLASRVRPTGGGVGGSRVTLADTTRAAPAGYTLDRAGGWLIRDAAETGWPRIDKLLDCPDVNAANASLSQRQFAANTLFDRGYAWLRTHSASSYDRLTGDAPRLYRLELTHCRRELLPGYTLRVIYRRQVGAYVAWAIDADLYVQSAAIRVDESGIQTVAVEASTVQATPDTDARALARTMRDFRAYLRHAQADEGLSSSLTGAPTGIGVRNGRVVWVTR